MSQPERENSFELSPSASVNAAPQSAAHDGWGFSGWPCVDFVLGVQVDASGNQTHSLPQPIGLTPDRDLGGLRPDPVPSDELLSDRICAALYDVEPSSLRRRGGLDYLRALRAAGLVILLARPTDGQ